MKGEWHQAMVRHGFIVEESGAFDPFYGLALQAAATKTEARVSVGLRSAKEYGTVYCTANVTITCPQTEQYIDLAGELAFRKALELTNDGATHIEAPTLPPWQEPT